MAVHRATLAYVLAEVDRLPDAPGTGVPLFDPDERRHLADVRDVFGGVRAVLAVALIVLAWRLVRGLRAGTGHLARLARDGALGAALLVGLVRAVAALPFEPPAGLPPFFRRATLFYPATSTSRRLRAVLVRRALTSGSRSSRSRWRSRSRRLGRARRLGILSRPDRWPTPPGP